MKYYKLSIFKECAFVKEKILELEEVKRGNAKSRKCFKGSRNFEGNFNIDFKKFQKKSDEFIKALNELGGTLKYIGKYDEVERNLKLALNIIKDKYGENNLAYATTLLNLIEVYKFAKKYVELKENYEKVVKIYQETSSEETLEYAAVCNNYELYFQDIQDFVNVYKQHMKSLYYS